ncbi:MAG: glycoside hydrolase family 9 protein [Oscillospiraceae bacterium]|nr:glycoside hydrolase family 9 protein [Oscillospiraceae bacterium]
MKNKFYINRLGYMTGVPKAIPCTVAGKTFQLVDTVSRSTVFSGNFGEPITDKDSGDIVRIADISHFNTPGKYYIKSGYRRSGSFTISEKPYSGIRKKVLRSLYLNRCGFDFDSTSGVFAHPACHRECHAPDGKTVDVSGGWHTMGGYERDISFTSLIVADLLYTLRLFGDNLDDTEKADILAEIRWGLEFMMKMQDTDGGVYSDVHTNAVSGPLRTMRPEADREPFYLGEKTCTAALRMCSLAALGSVMFFKSDDPSDRAFARNLSRAAMKSWIYVTRLPEFNYYCSTQGGHDDDVYAKETEFMWAVCEMYSLTGDELFSTIIEKRCLTSRFWGFGDSHCGGFAALSYLLTDRPRKRVVDALIRRRITERANVIYTAQAANGYRCSAAVGGGYSFGTNFRLLCNARTNALAYLITGDERHLRSTLDHICYLLGSNPNGKAFVTGNEHGFCHNPCHRLSASLSQDECIEGMVISGANTLRPDAFSKWNIKEDTPPACCYIDSIYSISTNEPGLHFSTPLLFLSAFLEDIGKSTLNRIPSPAT